jgi:acyl homoserine lactone synthase
LGFAATVANHWAKYAARCLPVLLKDDEAIESATIWECSRICAAARNEQLERSNSGVSFVLAELLVGIGDVARLAGLTQIVAVFDARIFRILEIAGCKPEVLGTPRKIGGTMSYAGLFNMDEAFQQAVRSTLGIEGSVLATDAEELMAA